MLKVDGAEGYGAEGVEALRAETVVFLNET